MWKDLKIRIMKKELVPCRFVIVFLVSILSLILNNGVHADSIWKKRVTTNTNLYNDNRARGIGDIVTVQINESTEITGTEDSSSDSAQSHSVNIDTANFLTKVLGDTSGYLPNIDSNTSHTFSGKGAYESNRNLSLELTAVVTELLANGNLIIEGNRDVNINGEKYNIKVSGIVRPIDISTDNIIQSSSIANANVTLEGKGFLTRAGKRGWWNRIYEVIWPF
ncbi:MAG: flagellar L-ring protein [Candidatus Brocadia fulgida]|uniref:Flagellar L-ring protein n=1 Tax=Candidatus Brocadia fulgida TaxID=380242 RepID=A0A0M2UTK6_9BACT|nr:MAG: flagellar L-ring protein [Candidatus Brocadia fulgida]